MPRGTPANIHNQIHIHQQLRVPRLMLRSLKLANRCLNLACMTGTVTPAFFLCVFILSHLGTLAPDTINDVSACD